MRTIYNFSYPRAFINLPVFLAYSLSLHIENYVRGINLNDNSVGRKSLPTDVQRLNPLLNRWSMARIYYP